MIVESNLELVCICTFFKKLNTMFLLEHINYYGVERLANGFYYSPCDVAARCGALAKDISEPWLGL